MRRRDFLRGAATVAAGFAAPPLVTRLMGAETLETRPLVAVARGGTDYRALVERVLTPFGGLRTFVTKGSRVVVKPNIGWDRTPELAGNTHPAVVEAVVRLALDAGASRVSVFDRTCNDSRRCYASSGIQAAVEAIGDPRVTVSFIDDARFVETPIPRGKSIESWPIYRDVLDADVYLNLPIAKNHGLAKLTLGLKNVMGVIGGKRGSIHWDIGQRLADLATVVRPTLTLIDATRILTANGPQGGSLDDVKVLETLVASTDTVAADAYATSFFGLEPSAITATVAAAEMGLGEMRLERIKVEKA